jgi:iron complex transport system substrate-binding protein
MSQAFEERRGHRHSAIVRPLSFQAGAIRLPLAEAPPSTRPVRPKESRVRSSLLLRVPALLLCASAVLVLVLSAACDDNNGDTQRPTVESQITEQPGVAYPFDVTRSDGKMLTIERAPARVISLSPGATEIIFAIGAEGALVAVDNQADYPPAASSFSTKVDAYEPNVEAIAALDADLVIVATDSGGIVGALDALGIPVLFIDINTDITTVEQVLGQIALYGRIFDRAAAANELTASLQQRILDVRERADAQETAPSVYHELDSTFFSAAEQSFIGDVYRILGADNIARDGGGTPYPQLSAEAIIAANPEIIVLADEEFGVTVDSVRSRPGWDVIDAVRNNRIYGVDPDIISRPGPRIVDALEQLADLFYPDGA